LRARRFILGGWFLLAAISPARGDSLHVAIEPGLVTPAGEGFLPLHIRDLAGHSVRAEDAALAIEIDGARVPSFESASIAEQLAILVDPSCIAEAERPFWAAELARTFSEAKPGSTRRLFLCDESHVREIPAASAESKEKIASEWNEIAESRLYDGVLECLGRLSTSPDLPERLVLVVVASGIEDADSRHPLLTCVEAADSARVAVHVLLIPAIENAAIGERRMRELAGKSGGMVRAGSEAAPLELRALLERVEDAQVIRLAGVSGPRSRFTVRVLAPDAAPASGSLARRTSLGYAPDRPIPWMAVGFGGVVAAGALSLWVRRSRPMGILRVTRGAPEKAIPLTRRGITIGGAVGNGLVLDDPRVSRNHAVIQVHGSEIKLVDLKSSNGTKVNGARITSHSLRDGDRILLAEAVEVVYERRARRPAKLDRAPAGDLRSTRPAFEEDDDDDDDDDIRDPLRERRV